MRYVESVMTFACDSLRMILSKVNSSSVFSYLQGVGVACRNWVAGKFGIPL